MSLVDNDEARAGTQSNECVSISRSPRLQLSKPSDQRTILKLVGRVIVAAKDWNRQNHR